MQQYKNVMCIILECDARLFLFMQINTKCLYMFFAFIILLQTEGAPNMGGGSGSSPHHNPQNQIKKKHRFCTHDDIKTFT